MEIDRTMERNDPNLDYLSSDERFKEYIESAYSWEIKCDQEDCTRMGGFVKCYTLTYTKCALRLPVVNG